MINVGLLLLFLILILIIAAGVAVFYIKKQLTTVSRNAFGTDSFLEGVRQQEKIYAETPKSVAGMTSFYLPRIQRDFPELSVPEMMQKSENQIKAALHAVEAQDLSLIADASEEFKKQIRLWIDENKKQGICEQFQNVHIHKTAISRYEKQAGCCIIKFQSAVEYRYAKWNRNEERPEPKMTQTRYDMEWVYVQDVEKLPKEKRAMGLNCPNCGAPVSQVGAKFCEYCGSAVEPINIRVWSLDQMDRDSDQY